MKILTVDNQSYELDFVPEEIEDIRYSVLDYSNKNDADYFFVPLVFLEIFNAPAAVLRIGNHMVKMPLDWSLIICEPDVGDPEVVPITSLNDRGFDAFVFNPLGDFRHNYMPVNIVDIYSDVKWFFPKLKQGQILAIPIETDVENPRCVYCAKEINKQNEIVSIDRAW